MGSVLEQFYYIKSSCKSTLDIQVLIAPYSKYNFKRREKLDRDKSFIHEIKYFSLLLKYYRRVKRQVMYTYKCVYLYFGFYIYIYIYIYILFTNDINFTRLKDYFCILIIIKLVFLNYSKSF